MIAIGKEAPNGRGLLNEKKGKIPTTRIAS